MIATKVELEYRHEWLAHAVRASAKHKDCDEVFYYVRLIELDKALENPSIMEFYIEDTIYKLKQAFADKGLRYE